MQKPKPTDQPTEVVKNLHLWATGMDAWLKNGLHPWCVKVSSLVGTSPGRAIDPPPKPPNYPPKPL
jgi:hypothetical protein